MEDMRNVALKAGVALPDPGGRGIGARGVNAPVDTASDPSGSSIFRAVQQAGLRLEPRKSSVEMLVVDHLEKMPTEN
jgi:uncharacterized protein (TIGR03435 family)